MSPLNLIATLLTGMAGVAVAGNGAMGSLTEAQAQRIQSFADRYDVTVDVVGSRAAGTADASSDFDYVIGGTSKIRAAARAQLPRGLAGGEIHPSRGETGIDVFNANVTPTDTSRPYIRFEPTEDQ